VEFFAINAAILRLQTVCAWLGAPCARSLNLVDRTRRNVQIVWRLRAIPWHTLSLRLANTSKTVGLPSCLVSSGVGSATIARTATQASLTALVCPMRRPCPFSDDAPGFVCSSE
jgi:hypothetical protein